MAPVRLEDAVVELNEALERVADGSATFDDICLVSYAISEWMKHYEEYGSAHVTEMYRDAANSLVMSYWNSYSSYVTHYWQGEENGNGMIDSR